MKLKVQNRNQILIVKKIKKKIEPLYATKFD